MKESSIDLIKNKITQRQQGLKSLLVNYLKRDRPFAGDKMPREAQVWALDNLGNEDMQDLINEFGEETINQTLSKIYQLKSRGIK